MATLQETLALALSFIIVALASQRVGRFFSRVQLPLITGFLFTGILAGPFVLGLIPEEAFVRLRFVDEVSLAVIAFAAGSELHLEELKKRLKSISYVTIGLVIATFTLTSLVVFALADSIPFMRDMSASGRLAVSLLAGSILIARSPSSAMAIVGELRARGPLTRTMITVTVVMDVVVIVVFSINSELAGLLVDDLEFNLGFVPVLIAELLAACGLGYLLGKALGFAVAARIPGAVKTGVLLLAGYGVFVLSAWIRRASAEVLPFEVLLEPLLVCVAASFVAVNYTPHRTGFSRILLGIGPPVYVAFFTLTGASLALGILVETWDIALVLFLVRLVAIAIGSLSGGFIAGEPKRLNRVSWMAYVTQAGIALGLAKEVAVEFPQMGRPFATIIISVIVLNQILGPPLLKWVLKRVGEAYRRREGEEAQEGRRAIVFGLEHPSLAVARLLREHNWDVRIASRKARNMGEEVERADFDIHPIDDLDAESLGKLEAASADAVVGMLSDEENLRICEILSQSGGTTNLIVRLNDRANVERFRDFGALIVEPSTAVVHLIEHLVRSPSAAPLLLGTDGEQDIADVEIRDASVQGMLLRDLHLPLDTLILSVHRDGRLLVPHGYTPLKLGDQLTVVGSPQSLEEVTARLEDN